MAKGPIVTTEVEFIIASVYQKHPKWKATEVRNEVSHILQKSNPKLPSDWPGLSTVQKVLAIVRKPQIDPQNKPWSMGTLNEYPIPPDAIPSVLKVWKHWDDMVREVGLDKLAFDPTLTIRGAKWAGRLAHVIDDIGVLAVWALQYASVEQMLQYLGKPFDSHVLDDELMKPDGPVIPELVIGSGVFADFVGGLVKEFSEKGAK